MSNVTANLSIGERLPATQLTVKTLRRHQEVGRLISDTELAVTVDHGDHENPDRTYGSPGRHVAEHAFHICTHRFGVPPHWTRARRQRAAPADRGPIPRTPPQHRKQPERSSPWLPQREHNSQRRAT